MPNENATSSPSGDWTVDDLDRFRLWVWRQHAGDEPPFGMWVCGPAVVAVMLSQHPTPGLSLRNGQVLAFMGLRVQTDPQAGDHVLIVQDGITYRAHALYPGFKFEKIEPEPRSAQSDLD